MDAWGDLGRKRVAWGGLSPAEAGADRGGRRLVETGEDTGEIKLLREWSGCRSRTLAALGAALVVLLAAVLALTYGNYLGDTAAPHG